MRIRCLCSERSLAWSQAEREFFPDDFSIIKGAIRMAIMLLGHLLFFVFVPQFNPVTA
jgi:hypothetical protein